MLTHFILFYFIHYLVIKIYKVFACQNNAGKTTTLHKAQAQKENDIGRQ
jgi:hypothetical protein